MLSANWDLLGKNVELYTNENLLDQDKKELKSHVINQ